jgi:hypothetical protein
LLAITKTVDCNKLRCISLVISGSKSVTFDAGRCRTRTGSVMRIIQQHQLRLSGFGREKAGTLCGFFYLLRCRNEAQLCKSPPAITKRGTIKWGCIHGNLLEGGREQGNPLALFFIYSQITANAHIMSDPFNSKYKYLQRRIHHFTAPQRYTFRMNYIVAANLKQ